MKWSRSACGTGHGTSRANAGEGHDGTPQSNHGGYRNACSGITRRNNRRQQNWNTGCCPSTLEPYLQDTYICCAYSPRCFIIQKVKPASSQSISEAADQNDTFCEIEASGQDDNLLGPSSSSLVDNESPADGDRSAELQVVYPEAMEEITGITASLTSEATSTASSTITPMTTTEPIGYPAAQQQNHEVFTNTPSHAEAEVPSNERTIPLHELKSMLRQQLEYYFSRENLATDAYLRSQMDGDQYVPIITIAKFNQIRRLTEDLSLIVEALRESPYVQVDEAGERVRPSQRSIVLILREIPESTPIKDFEELFSGENCPKFSRCEFAHNDTWYVLFETDDDAKKAYCYLREEAKTFNGKPIMARIKASLTSAPYSHSYKNGVVNPPSTEAYNQQPLPQQQQVHMQYTYANIPNEGYNNQQICPPFYPPTMLQAWAPTTTACVDLAAVFSMNGLSPQAAYRPLTNTNKNNYPARDRPVKSFNPQQNYVNRSDQNSRYYNRNQSYIPRQQQAAPYHNVLNANSFDYMYPSGSRNLHSFAFDNINFFAPPNLCFRKIPSGHTSYTSQNRHNQMVLPPRNAMGVSAINTQDQSYIPVGGASAAAAGGSVQFTKDAAAGASTAMTKNVDMQGKENWIANQKQRNKKWSKDNGTNTSNRHFSENADFFAKPLNGNVVKPESPKFDLETASFPPLPGCMDTDVLEVDVYESRLSDIVKGTVKPSTRDSKTQTSEQGLMKDSSTLTIEETVETSDGAFSPPATLIPDISLAQVSSENTDNWGTEPLTSDAPNESCMLSNSISSTTQTTIENTVFSSTSSVVTHTAPTNSLSTSTLLISSVPADAEVAPELEAPGNVPNDSEKQAPIKPAKAKPQQQQPDTLPKNKSSDLPSPKSKTPDSAGRSKLDSAKENKAPQPPKHRAATFSNNKSQESSFSKDKTDSTTTVSNSNNAADVSVPKSLPVDVLSPKDKVMQGHCIPVKGRSFDLSPKTKGPETEPTVSLLSVNGHIDSESTVSSEDEKPFRKLTYSEVAIRAKDKVEKLAQELKERERQEALVRHHRQQEMTAQSRQGSARGPFRDFPRRISDRPGSRDWRDRRKPARAVSLPSAGQ